MNLKFIIFFLIINSVVSCASRTKTAHLNEDLQTILTLGTNKIARTVNTIGEVKNNTGKTVLVVIHGQVILADKCIMSSQHTNFIVELRLRSSHQKRPMIETKLKEDFFYHIEQPVIPGDYSLNLIHLRNGQVVQTAAIKIDQDHDRFSFVFDGCP